MACIRLRIVHALAFSLALVSSASGSSIIFSTFGPGDSFNGTAGQELLYLSIGATLLRGVSVAFVPSTNVELGSVSVAVQTPLDFTLTIAQDEDWSWAGGTNGAGAAVESFVVPAQATAGVVTVTSATNPVLLAGNIYWVEIQPNPDWLGAGVTGTWFFNDQGLDGTISTFDDFCRLLCAPYTRPGELLPAVRVTSFEPSAVPEPASMFLLAIGLAALAAGKRIARRS
jgi:hypothetical protein